MKSAVACTIAAAVVFASTILFVRPRVAAAIAPLLASNVDTVVMEQQIVAKEQEGLEALKNGNLELFSNLTADDAIFVDAAGPANKAQVLKNVAGFKLTDYLMEDVNFVQISATSGLIVYKATEKGASHGREFTAHVYVSSIWIQRDAKWVCLFSQETSARVPAPVAAGK